MKSISFGAFTGGLCGGGVGDSGSSSACVGLLGTGAEGSWRVPKRVIFQCLEIGPRATKFLFERFGTIKCGGHIGHA